MYVKIIKSGNLIEQWEYEKEPVVRKQRRFKVNIKRSGRSWANLERSRKAFYRLVRANLTGDARPALLTLTMYQNYGIAYSYKCFTAYIRRLRDSSIIGQFRYITVPEFQKRGAVHFHCLIWGITDDIIDNERSTRLLQSRWLYGFLDITRTDGSPKLAGYLSKYMSKAMQDIRLMAQKGYTASRNIMRPMCLNTPTQISYKEDIIGLSTHYQLDKQYSFNTKWLGKANYKSYICQ